MRRVARAGVLAAGGAPARRRRCDFYYYRVPSPDQLWHIIPWFDHMITARYVRPYRDRRRAAVHAGGHGAGDRGRARLVGRVGAAARPRRPTRCATRTPRRATTPEASPAGPAVPVLPREVEAAGDTLYQNFCTVCHGVAGDAQGTGVQPDRRAVAAHRPGARVQRRLPLQHHPLRSRRHAALRRQGVPAGRPVGHREPHPEAAGREPGAAGAGRRRRRDPAGAQRDRVDRREASMSPGTVHQRLVERALAGKYDLFLGARRRARRSSASSSSSARWAATTRPGRWQLFHVNWLYFTGLAGGSVAFAAVQKITNAKWSGLVIRFAEASVAFLPLSLIGAGADLHARLSRGLRPDGERGPRHGRTRRRCGSRGRSCSAGCCVGLARAVLGRLEADPGRPHPRHARHPSGRGARAPLALRALDPGLRRHAAERARPTTTGSTGWPRSTSCSTPSSSAWSRSTGSWRCSRTGSATCWAASTSWARSWAPTCCWR